VYIACPKCGASETPVSCEVCGDPARDSVVLFKKGPIVIIAAVEPVKLNGSPFRWLRDDHVEFTAIFLRRQVFGKQVFVEHENMR
jgi:hypothetical protein